MREKENVTQKYKMKMMEEWTQRGCDAAFVAYRALNGAVLAMGQLAEHVPEKSQEYMRLNKQMVALQEGICTVACKARGMMSSGKLEATDGH